MENLSPNLKLRLKTEGRVDFPAMNPEEKKNSDFSFEDIPVLGGGKKQDEFSFEALPGTSSDQGRNSGGRTPEDSSLALFERMLADSPAKDTAQIDKNEITSFSDEELNKTNIEEASAKKLWLSKIFAQKSWKNNKMLLIGGAVAALVFVALTALVPIMFVLNKREAPPPVQAVKPKPANQTPNKPGSGDIKANPQPPPPAVTEDSDEIKAKFESAKLLYNEKKFKEALDIYREIQPKTVKKADLLLLIGQCLYGMGEKEAALKSVDESIQAGSTNIQSYIVKIELLNALGKFDEAGTFIGELKKKFQDITAVLPDMAENLYLRNKPDEALVEFKKCQRTELSARHLKIFAKLSEKTSPRDASALYVYSGKKFQDITSLGEAIRLTPKLEDKIDIMKDAVSSLKAGPKKSQCNLLLAELLLKDGKKKEVENIVAETDPGSFSAGLCVIYIKTLTSLSMKEKIKTYLPAMLEKNYSDLDFSRSVQDLLKGTDNEEFKTEIFRSLYDKNKDAVSEYLYGRALGNSSVAKDYFQGAIKKNPLFDAAWFGLGKCFMHERNWSSAVEAFSKASEIDRYNLEARFLLDLSRLYKGDGEPAVKDYEDYLRERNAMGEKGMMQLISLAQRLDDPKLSEEYLKTILANPKLGKQHKFAEVKNKLMYGHLSDADFTDGFPGQARNIYILYLLGKNRENEVLNLTTPPEDFPDFWKVFLCWKKDVQGWKENAELLVAKSKKSGDKAVELIASLWLDKLPPDALREFAPKIPYEDEPIFYWMLAEKYLKDGNKTKAKVCFSSALKDSRNMLNKVIRNYSGNAQ